MKKKLKMLIIFCVFVYGKATNAQEAVITSGGNGTGSGGMVSYSIGQMVYSTISNGSDTITQGVEQPYEIYLISGNEEVKGIRLECVAYPNPAIDIIKLIIQNNKSDNLSYQLYDIKGKLLQNNNTDGLETNITMTDLLPGNYFLKVTDNTKEVKVFKIVKN